MRQFGQEGLGCRLDLAWLELFCPSPSFIPWALDTYAAIVNSLSRFAGAQAEKVLCQDIPTPPQIATPGAHHPASATKAIKPRQQPELHAPNTGGAAKQTQQHELQLSTIADKANMGRSCCSCCCVCFVAPPV